MRYGQFASNVGDGAARLFQRAASTATEDALEYKQAWIRLALLVLISSYAAAASIAIAPDRRIAPWAWAVLGYFVAYTPIALGLLYLVRRYPGHYPARRLFSMTNDYAGLAFAIIVGCQVMLPAYGLIMWVTVGNGLRFGSRYMIVAAIMAQITLATITALTPYWQANPPLVVTLSFTTLIVPLYIRTLLHSIEQARLDAEEANTAKSRFHRAGQP